MSRIRLGPPCTLIVALGCVAGTYLPGAAALGISGGLAALASPLTWLRLIAWPFVHVDTAHLLGNMMLFLLLSPGLEAKQGWVEYCFCLLVTSVIIGVGHLTFGANGAALIGASGWVFMMILLATFSAGEPGTISVPTLVVAALFGWQEIRAAFSPSPVSQFAHLLGGACGLVYGLLGSGHRAPAAPAERASIPAPVP
ncbi:MAG TPA: rhomboid family intramembrane serine protease [Lacunisphaera sp.]|nr:rhomboid family intramembrane serine protease [Lacunisphaera sp.]